jgi:hypothetical protein
MTYETPTVEACGKKDGIGIQSVGNPGQAGSGARATGREDEGQETHATKGEAMIVTMGRIVMYKLSELDVTHIMRRRTTPTQIAVMIGEGTWPMGAQAHIGNAVAPGQVVPLLVTTVQEPVQDVQRVNGQCILDGTDTLWVIGVLEGTENGSWAWPVKA